MSDYINATWSDSRTVSKRIPVFVFPHYSRRIAYIRVSVAAEVDGLVGRVVNFEVLVIAAPFGIFREKQPALRGSRQTRSEEQSRQQQVE